MDDAVFVIIVLLRVGVPLVIPRFPLPGIVAALIIDAADQTILAAFDAEPANYQGYDKALDIYYLAVAYLSTLRNWPRRAAFVTAQFLWYYRLIGVVAFEFTGARALLIIFPNTFEYFFIAYEAIRLSWDPNRLRSREIYLMAAAIWVGIKLPQEWWIHIAKLDFTDALSNPAFAVAVVVVMVVVAVVARRFSQRAPASDWAPDFDVDANRTTVPFRRAEPLFRRFELLNHPLVEKSLLTGLVVSVFSQVFAIEATVTQITIGCGFIVVVNSLVSDFLRRRGNRWRNSLTEFLALLTINWGALIVYLLLRPNLDADIDPGPTLVMLGLLTLIVILYDRYSTLRRVNTAVVTRQPERRERDFR